MAATKVHWREWGAESFREAREQDKPILLDISAVWCHWCHVMDEGIAGDPVHTGSYTDPEIAEYINTHFIPIRVDTDRRPDINARYNMGGWPTTAFLTPEGDVLTGGTYFTPAQMRGLLKQVQQYYHSNREAIRQRAQELKGQAQAGEQAAPRARPDARLSWGIITQVIGAIAQEYDPGYGGLGSEPKFPQPEAWELALAQYVSQPPGDRRLLEMVTNTLTHMGGGGMYDHVEGGFFRYSTTRDWSVPHFEKMAEDHGRLVPLYLHAWQVTGEQPLYNILLKTLDYLTTVLYDYERGVFAGSQDADEIYYGRSLPERRKLKPPFVDWTVYTDWNARLASAFLEAAVGLNEPRYRELALRTLNFLWERLVPPGQAACHYLDGQGTHLPGLLGDQASLAHACLDAYMHTGSIEWLERAEHLLLVAERTLADNEGGGFFDRPGDPDAPGLLAQRQKLISDNAAMAEAYLILHHLTGERGHRDRAEETLRVFAHEFGRYGFMAAGYALAVQKAIYEPVVVHIVGTLQDSATQRLLQAAWSGYQPWRIVHPLDPERDRERLAVLGYPTNRPASAYVCRNQTCSAPTGDPEEVRRLVAGP